MNLRKVLAVLIFSLACISARSQDIRLKGKLTDKTDNSPIAGATIKLTSQRDSTKIRQVTSDQSGNFEIGSLNASMYVLRITYSGYEIIEQRINIQASNATPLSFPIAKVATDLGEVTIVSKAAPVRQKSDTTEFSASQFKVNPDATAEDLIKKLPGIVIDKQGNVTTMGEQVRKVTVDGKDFFGDDATA
ncbi:MAG: carboxypeptidase regulatory-like domain-containing protein, partial [Ferruginibacter sp.]